MSLLVLEKYGLSLELLANLSFTSELGIPLKKNLHYFNKEALLEEVGKALEWYGKLECLRDLALDYRIKSMQSARAKYERYYPDAQTRKVFNDLLGCRALCDGYDEVLELAAQSSFRMADMSSGKADDDGYRGVHLYYQLNSMSYPIEIQFNSFYDRQINNWLHKYLYKKHTNADIGLKLRKLCESAKIKTETEFKEALDDVLSDCQGCR